MSILTVGIDPGFSHIGVVALRGKDKSVAGHKVVDCHKLKYPPTKKDPDTYENWHMLAFEINEVLGEIKNNLSSRKAMFIGVLAPIIVPSGPKGMMKLHVATGVIYGICTKWGIASMKKDTDVRRTLGPLIGCPMRFKPPGEATKFVRGTQFEGQRVLWADCPNEHCAHAYLMAKYLMLG